MQALVGALIAALRAPLAGCPPQSHEPEKQTGNRRSTDGSHVAAGRGLPHIAVHICRTAADALQAAVTRASRAKLCRFSRKAESAKRQSRGAKEFCIGGNKRLCAGVDQKGGVSR
jgi:hypothetical protein